MVVRYNKKEAEFILECLKDYKRLVKKYYGNSSLILSKLRISIKKAERGKAETIKEEKLISEKEARGAYCEKCE
jgi:hypothetical protein|tara:strand:- start:2904 stop:3125 length:222 start_codon:yes stop_codon:yes gene_type:complete